MCLEHFWHEIDLIVFLSLNAIHTIYRFAYFSKSKVFSPYILFSPFSYNLITDFAAIIW